MQIQSLSVILPTGMVPSNNSASGAHDPVPQKADGIPGVAVILLGISNGVLLLCLLASASVIIRGTHAKKFEL
jgi:hypothetical protein